MRMAVERFDLSESDAESWAFLCECGDGACAEWVALKLAAFRELRADGAASVLADGHVERGPRTSSRARELVEAEPLLEPE